MNEDERRREAEEAVSAALDAHSREICNIALQTAKHSGVGAGKMRAASLGSFTGPEDEKVMHTVVMIVTAPMTKADIKRLSDWFSGTIHDFGPAEGRRLRKITNADPFGLTENL